MLTARCIGEFSLKAGDRVWLLPTRTPAPLSTRRVRSSGGKAAARGPARSRQKRRSCGRRLQRPICEQEERENYLEKFRLDRKTAVVTGAGQGIGLACAEALAEAGAKVVIADRDLKAPRPAQAVSRPSYDAEVVNMTWTDSARVSEVRISSLARHGRIDILVNNAGIARSETPRSR